MSSVWAYERWLPNNVAPATPAERRKKFRLSVHMAGDCNGSLPSQTNFGLSSTDQFDCGTRILRVISRAGRPCHYDLRYNVSLSDFSDAEISRCANCLTWSALVSRVYSA